MLLSEGRWGMGILGRLDTLLNKAGLTPKSKAKIIDALANELSSENFKAAILPDGGLSADTLQSMQQKLNGVLDSKDAGMAGDVLNELNSKGAFGALSGAAASVALVTGFTGQTLQGGGENPWLAVNQTANAMSVVGAVSSLKKLFIDSGALKSVGQFFKSLGGATAQQVQQAAEAANGNAAQFAEAIAQETGDPAQAATIEQAIDALPADQRANLLDTMATGSGADAVVAQAQAQLTTDVLDGISAGKLQQAATEAGGDIAKFAELAATDGEITSVGQQEAIKSALEALPADEQANFLNTLKAGGTVADALGGDSGSVSSDDSFVTAQSDEYFDAASSFEDDLTPPSPAEASGSGEIAALEQEGLTAGEAQTASGIASEIDVTAGSAADAAKGAGVLATVLKGADVLGGLANFLFTATDIWSAIGDFKSGQIAAGVLNVGSAAALSISGAATIAGLVFADTWEIPVIGEIAGVVGIVLGVIAAILGSRHHSDPNQTLAQSGVGNGQDYWQPDVTSAQNAANKGSSTQALIGLLQQVQQQNTHLVYGGRMATPVAGPIVAQLQPLIQQLQALPEGQKPPASLLTQIQSVLGVPAGSQIAPTKSVNAVDQMTFQDVETRLQPAN